MRHCRFQKCFLKINKLEAKREVFLEKSSVQIFFLLIEAQKKNQLLNFSLLLAKNDEKKFFFSKQIHVHIYTTLIITVILKIQLHHITVTHSLFSYTLVYYKGQLLSFLFSLFVVFNNDIASCCRHTLAYFIDTITYKEYL